MAVPKADREAERSSGIYVGGRQPGASQELEEFLWVRRPADRTVDHRRPQSGPGRANGSEEGGPPLAQSHDSADPLAGEVGRCTLEHPAGDRATQPQVMRGSTNHRGGQGR